MLWFVKREGLNYKAAQWGRDVLFIEVKNGADATFTKAELAMLELMRDAEVLTHVVRSVDDVERLLRR